MYIQYVSTHELYTYVFTYVIKTNYRNINNIIIQMLISSRSNQPSHKPILSHFAMQGKEAGKNENNIIEYQQYARDLPRLCLYARGLRPITIA